MSTMSLQTEAVKSLNEASQEPQSDSMASLVLELVVKGPGVNKMGYDMAFLREQWLHVKRAVMRHLTWLALRHPVNIDHQPIRQMEKQIYFSSQNQAPR
jgi:hypothetical protein